MPIGGLRFVLPTLLEQRQSEAKMVIGKYFFWPVGMLIIFSISATVGKASSQSAESNRSEPRHSQSVEKKLMQVASEANKQLPTMIDRHTRMDSSAAGPGKRIAYYYTLMDVVGRRLDQNVVRESKSKIINGVCSGPYSAKMLKDGVIMEYIYRNLENHELVRFEISQHDCASI